MLGSHLQKAVHTQVCVLDRNLTQGLYAECVMYNLVRKIQFGHDKRRIVATGGKLQSLRGDPWEFQGGRDG
jgi:ABC-type sulfate transport system substrate-binding protein